MAKESTTTFLNCSSDAIPQPSYEWTHLQRILSNTSILKIKDIQNVQAGQYECTVTNIAGTKMSISDLYVKCKLKICLRYGHSCSLLSQPLLGYHLANFSFWYILVLHSLIKTIHQMFV